MFSPLPASRFSTSSGASCVSEGLIRVFVCSAMILASSCRHQPYPRHAIHLRLHDHFGEQPACQRGQKLIESGGSSRWTGSALPLPRSTEYSLPSRSLSTTALS